MKLIRQIATGNEPAGRAFATNDIFGRGSSDSFCVFSADIFGSRVWATCYRHAWSEMGSLNRQRYGGGFTLPHGT